MIEAIRSTKIMEKQYEVGSLIFFDDDWSRVEEIDLGKHFGPNGVSEVFLIKLDSGYKISAPFEDYEFIYKEDKE